MFLLRTLRQAFVCVVILTGLMGTVATASAQPTVLVFDSQPGDYIGGGQRATYTPAGATFTVDRNYNNGVRLSINAPGNAYWWSLDFGAAYDAPLAVGSYAAARRFGFADFNGLHVGGSGRGCNVLTGRFDVREIVYGTAGAVLRFAADFEQHCEDGTPALFGAVRYNSTISDAVPFGGRYPSYGLTMSPSWGGVVVGENILCGNDASTCAVTLSAPAFQLLKAVPSPGYQLLGWAGDCYGGEVINVLVHSSMSCAAVFGATTPAAPRDGLMLDSQAGDYIGLGVQSRYTDSTSLWSVQSENGGNLLRFSIDGSDGSSNIVAFRAPGAYSNRLVPGDYTGAARAPFSYPAAGLDAYGNGRGCNTLTGRFTVYESVYNPDGTIARFAADFEQHCEGGVAALFGSVRYHSTTPGVLPFGGAYPSFRVTVRPSLYGSITGGGMDCPFFWWGCTLTRSTAGPLTLTATPAAGYAFSEWIGNCSGTSASTTVVVNAPDTVCAARFIRTLADAAPPVLSRLPGNQRVLTTNPAGAAVTWMPPGAVDAVDGMVAAACAPASGSLFPLGDTMVTCSATDRSGNQATTAFTVTVARRPAGVDLDGDHQSDLLWRNADGQIVVWMMNGQTRLSTEVLGTVTPDWRIAAVGDFTGDGRADLVWQQDTGTVALWEMEGLSHVGTHILYEGYTSWRVAAAADLNGDGRADLIWQGANGSVAAWLMSGLAMDSVSFLFDADTPWRVVAAGDLDADGHPDLIWQSPTGSAAAWMMNGLSRREVVILAGDSEWRIEGIANLNGDNSVDLVWQNPYGTVYGWLMNGADRLDAIHLYEGGTDWRVTGPR